MDLKKFGNINLLIIDDDMFNRQLIMACLSKFQNINCLEAENGLEGLKVLEKNSIDMILLDLHMPIMNGALTLENIKKEFKYNLIPVILITTDENELKKMNAVDADDLIFKPFKVSVLENILYNHLVLREEKLLIAEEFISSGINIEIKDDLGFHNRDIILEEKETLQEMPIIEPQKIEKREKVIIDNNPIIHPDDINSHSLMNIVNNLFKNVFSFR